MFDLRTNRRTDVDLTEHNSARALGAGFVAGYRDVISLADGAKRPLPYWHQVFAIERGIAYAAVPAGPVDGLVKGSVTIHAHDARDGAKSARIADVRVERVSTPYASLELRNVVRYGPVHIVWGRHGWWLFDGASWGHRDWLEAVPK